MCDHACIVDVLLHVVKNVIGNSYKIHENVKFSAGSVCYSRK